MKLTTAIIPVAGYGTRRLPITKTIEKCMLPICNRPIVDYTVEACVAAGLTDIIFVVSPEHRQLRSYYEPDEALEQYLKRQGKESKLADLPATGTMRFHYIVQDITGAYGTAIPVWLAKKLVQDEECFIVMTGDDFLYNPTSPAVNIQKMVAAMEQAGAEGCLLGIELAKELIPHYSLVQLKHDPTGPELLEQLIEKPDISQVTSNIANISRYIFTPQIFPYIERLLAREDTKKEYYITDVINAYAAEHRMVVERATGEYLDGGNLDSWIAANNFVYAAQFER
ncbi:MAG TPA: sugar phosphate nucleotidyltransferase [Candidatus Acidoferrum sp.]|nr:sugar phosphate nucleotidyltransferase [Candidatus Acidoferrum sp.]